MHSLNLGQPATKSYKPGFTIVELLIVIVVIAILAVIVTVAYNGITQNAVEASLKADLRNTANKLVEYKTLNNDAYPDSLDVIPELASSDTSLSYNKKGGNGFCLAATSLRTDYTYRISETGVLEEGPCPFEWAQVTLGTGHTCALSTGAKAYCWGQSGAKLGNGTTDQRNSPTEVAQGQLPNGVSFTQLSAGENHTCGIASNNRVYCWGSNANGRLGDGTTTTRLTPVEVLQGEIPSGAILATIDLGHTHACVLASDGWVYCWGYNALGPLGTGDLVSSSTPVALERGAIPNDVSIVQISAGSHSTCAIGSNERAYCWGYNRLGKLGDASTVDKTEPVAVAQGTIPAGVGLVQITTASDHSCAVGTDGRAYCWGSRSANSLGDGNSSGGSISPTTVLRVGDMPSDAVAKSIFAMHNRTCLQTVGDDLYCWGNNESGNIGIGTISYSVPQAAKVHQGEMPTGTTFEQMSGMHNICGLASDKQIYCWGSNSFGGLGDGTTTTRTVPTKVLTPTV